MTSSPSRRRAEETRAEGAPGSTGLPSDASTPPLPLRPTAALARAVLGGCVIVALALLFGRPSVMAAGVPLLAWAVMARARRARRSEESVPGPRLMTSAHTITEDATATVTFSSPRGTLTSVAVPLPPSTDVDPLRGAVVSEGTAAVSMTVHRWGRIDIGPAHVQVLDAYGAHRGQRGFAAMPLRVLPTASVLDAPTALPGPIGVSGVHLSSRRGDGTALADVREFRPGDRLARINWAVTSRTGRMHTNATFTEQDTDVLIVTDTTADVHPAPFAGPNAPSSLDLTVRATTAVARHYLSLGDRVGIHDLGGTIRPVRYGSGPRHLRVILDVLSRADRDRSVPISQRPLRGVRAGTLTVVCSPLLNDSVISQISQMLAIGADVIVVDTLPPSVGSVEHLTARDTSRAARRAERFWPEAWALRRLLREEVVQELREAGVPITPWEGPSSLAPVLLSLTRMRQAPRMRRA